MSVIDTTSHRQLLEWENPSTDKQAYTTSSRCECGEAGDFFHYFGVKLNDAKSVEEFKAQIVALIQHIWLASNARKMSPCIITTVRECTKTYKQTKLSVDPVVQFYNFRLESQSLPVWIILHSPSDDPSLEPQVDTRHRLLQIFLDEFPLTETIRDELYTACARKGYNNFFSRVRLESLRQLQVQPCSKTTHAEYIEIGRGLRPSSGLAETLKVVPTRSGFEMKWFVPDMSQRLESGLFVGVEFVAKGQVWGMYIRAKSGRFGQWELLLDPLKPSQINLDKEVFVSFVVSRYVKRKFLNQGSTNMKDRLRAGMFTKGLPKGGMPDCYERCFFTRFTVYDVHRSINEDGSCYLTLTLRTPGLTF